MLISDLPEQHGAVLGDGKATQAGWVVLGPLLPHDRVCNTWKHRLEPLPGGQGVFPALPTTFQFSYFLFQVSCWMPPHWLAMGLFYLDHNLGLWCASPLESFSPQMLFPDYPSWLHALQLPHTSVPTPTLNSRWRCLVWNPLGSTWIWELDCHPYVQILPPSGSSPDSLQLSTLSLSFPKSNHTFSSMCTVSRALSPCYSVSKVGSMRTHRWYILHPFPVGHSWQPSSDPVAGTVSSNTARARTCSHLHALGSGTCYVVSLEPCLFLCLVNSSLFFRLLLDRQSFRDTIAVTCTTHHS